MRSLASAGAYISMLTGDCDIITMSEHRMYECELNKLSGHMPGFTVYAKASADLQDGDVSRKPGHCGLLIAWAERLDPVVTQSR